ncbi:hypothetical protein AU467_23765 [Mesorhizobium loti]|uniref:HTH luxR-type domain-containing protein n=1 Tax=Rhizobium loti TaxID=381 RepID=A0A101KS36_RHILI|nr:hypothetical protein AU467_23765 [Mesorhizobium loti]
MLDKDGKVIRVNRTAESLLGRDLQVTGGRLVSTDRIATDALYRSLRQLLCVADSAASMPPSRLPRATGHPLLAYPMRLAAVSPNALAPCQAAVVVLDPDIRPLSPEDALRCCFGLTSAEAKLARKISTGEDLKAASNKLAISYETARNHLKAIFAKTDTHRQRELIALLARVANGPLGAP